MEREPGLSQISHARMYNQFGFCSRQARPHGMDPSLMRHLRGPAKTSYNNVEVRSIYRLSLNQTKDQDAARPRTNDTGWRTSVQSLEGPKVSRHREVQWRALTHRRLESGLNLSGVCISHVLMESSHKALHSEDRSEIDLGVHGT